MNPILLTHYTATTCLGVGNAALLQALRDMRSGLAPCDFDTVNFPTWAGTVASLDEVALPQALQHYDCRNNRLAQLGLQADGFADAVRQAMQRHGADRVAVVLGTSTAGIYSTELAYRERDAQTGVLPLHFHYAETHNTYSVGAFVKDWFSLQGPAEVVSTACSSSAKVFASAARLLQAGLIDAVVVGAWTPCASQRCMASARWA